ncbi:chloride channel protein [Pseudoteredinibacter isoporae]|uniref:H+/Cl- antiporter ClcA n=1 Tax=Pseudoteredinibacter isoporae TaxID=570281 RepID=A0A7X0JQX7_9GAMM|nr:chloride channel protein [Pseudoteredinibacter isoporae]MBB6519730.1 H+/Cl- antiporter ClcA [Pseudoteredinibacter isoporae]NHO85311.1 chloride channel protein [Pseudoteredinibacter isoporae]NIB26237.1 chloride channel protein [Pseudoteredinibacter isoporae]
MSQRKVLKNKLSAVFRRRLSRFADSTRHRLAHIDALPLMTLLGLLSGLLAAAVIVLFRLAIDLPSESFFSGKQFEDLPASARFALPLIGAVIIGLFLQALTPSHRQLSVAHVLSRLHHFQGRMPGANIIVQFIGGCLAQITGQSLGREGPAVHLGAGMASQLGQFLKLPNNSLRILVGCGVASAIAASFDTPIAGVIFAMEVVLMEYTISGFIPVILASVAGAAISKAVFAQTLSFAGLEGQLVSLWELPYIALGGIAIALAAGLFIKLQLLTLQMKSLPIVLKTSAAGLITGALAIFWPQIMGNGYDTILSSANGELGLQLLIALVFAKIIASAVSAGAGISGGVIGPVMVIGACLGAVLGQLGATFSPVGSTSTELYVLMGATAMMAAVLNAPLAALLAVLELSQSPDIIFPAMLMIVVACLATRQWFCHDGIFLAQLRTQGLPIETSPSQQVLSRAGVRSVMSGRCQSCSTKIDIEEARLLLKPKPNWLVLDSKRPLVMKAADLSRYLEEAEEEISEIDLLAIPGSRLQACPIDQRSNLFEAKTSMIEGEAEALIVTKQSRWQTVTIGVITQEDINNFYG